MLLIAVLLAMQPLPTSANATEPKAEDKVICRREDSVNTRIRTKKICRKQSEWDAIAKANEDDIRRSANQRQNPGNIPGN